ncbi:MAG: hypothetical protein ACREJ2_12320 [Planctomycetota bacterium]
MALRRRGAKKPEPEEEELEEGEDEEAGEEASADETSAEEEEGDEEAEGGEEGEEAEGEEEEGGEDEEGDEEGDEEEEDEEAAVPTRSRRGPAARGTIKDKPLIDGYTWMAVVTTGLFVVAIIVLITDHSVHWRYGVEMPTDPVYSTTHFNSDGEQSSSALGARFGGTYDPAKDTFGQDGQEYEEVTKQDATDFPILLERVTKSQYNGGRPAPVLPTWMPTSVTPLLPLSGLSAVEWVRNNPPGSSTSSSETPAAGGGATAPTTTPATGGTTPATGGATNPTTPGTVTNPTTPGNPVAPTGGATAP